MTDSVAITTDRPTREKDLLHRPDGLTDDEWKAHVAAVEHREQDLDEITNLGICRTTYWTYISTPHTDEVGPWVPRFPISIERVTVTCLSQGSGSSTVDVKVNGTSVGTATLDASTTTQSTDIDPPKDVNPDDQVSVEFATVGASLSDVTVEAHWRHRLGGGDQ